MNLFNKNTTNYSLIFVISCLSLTFQDHNFYSGLDGSYYWAFNYIINFIPTQLSNTTFIYGPLAFLHYTVCYGYLIIIGCIFQILLKFILGFAIFKLSPHLSITRTTGFLLFILCCLTIFSPEAYLNLNIILFLMLFYHDNRSSYLITIAIFTAFGYYYKCSIALSGVLFQGAFFIYLSYFNRKIDLKLLLRIILLNLISILIIGLILFQSFNPIITSFSTYYHNVIMFSESSSYYNRTENFILLILCFLSLFSIYFINKDRIFRLFWILALLFLYTNYTHGIVRMDDSHYMGFILCLLLIIILVGLFYNKLSKYTYPLLALSFFSYYGNLGNKVGYGEFAISIPNGPKNMYDYIIDHDAHKDSCLKFSISNLQSTNKIDDATLKELSKGSVDFFPWDLLFVEANKMSNWKPRPYLQSLNMSNYFDKKTAEYFNSKQAPDYLVWHSVSYGDNLIGLDNSYLLTNEFHTVTSIISNYSTFNSSNGLLFLKRRYHKIPYKIIDITDAKETKSGQWIQVPGTNDILGCSINYEFNPLRSLKKLVYRDDEFFIEYRTSGNEIIKRRIWPTDSKDFIWILPFTLSFNDTLAYKDVKEIRFSNTNEVIHSGKLFVQFKTLKFEGMESGSANKIIYKWSHP